MLIFIVVHINPVGDTIKVESCWTNLELAKTEIGHIALRNNLSIHEFHVIVKELLTYNKRGESWEKAWKVE